MTPIGVAIDPAAKKIYWANYGGDKVSFARLDNGGGGDLNIIGTTVSAPWGVTVDSGTEKVFWGNFTTNALDFAGLDGTGGGILSTTGAAQLGPMPGAIDHDTGRIYWSNWNSPRGLMSAKVNGTGGGGTLYPSPGDAQIAMPTVLKSPKGAGAPAITAPGSTTPTTLSCSKGSWAADQLGELLYRAPRTFTYSWTFNGSPLGGATAATLSASATGDYRCTVTAANFAGSTSQTSAAVHRDAAAPAAAARRRRRPRRRR